MKRNIRLLTQESCEELLKFTNDQRTRLLYNKESFDGSFLKFLEFKTNCFINEYISLGTSSKDDFANSKMIFSQLMNLDKVQASDKRLWVSLTHTVFFPYTKKRWNVNADSSNETIISRFHFEGTGIESRMRNSISRLWWSAKITYDPDREDRFELTRLLWEKQDIITSLAERSLGTYPNVLHAFLEVYLDNKHLREVEIRTLAKGLNAVGGVKVLPSLGKLQIKAELRRISEYNKIEIK